VRLSNLKSSPPVIDMCPGGRRACPRSA